MATTETQVNGDILDLTMTDDVSSGDIVVVGKIVGVAQINALTGEVCPVKLTGVHKLPKTSANALAVGGTIYATATSGEITSTSSGNTKAGYVVEAAGNGVTEVVVRLVPNC